MTLRHSSSFFPLFSVNISSFQDDPLNKVHEGKCQARVRAHQALPSAAAPKMRCY